MNRPLLAVAGLIAAGGTAAGVIYVASPGGEEEVVLAPSETSAASASADASATPSPAAETPTPAASSAAPAGTPGPGETLWRWGNVTVIVPEEADLAVRRDVAYPTNPKDGGPILCLTPRKTGGSACIDADTGEVVLRDLVDPDNSDIDGALATVRVGDPMSDPLPWPYGGTPVPTAKRDDGLFTFWEPDPAAGIVLSRTVAEGQAGENAWISIENVRSRRRINLYTGEVIASADQIAAEDREAFDIWTQAIEPRAKP